jgi:transcriptional regulator with XRE-family HTH domain
VEISPEQVKAERLLLNWTQERLADEVGVEVETVVSIKSGDSSGGYGESLVVTTLATAGIEFTSRSIQDGLRGWFASMFVRRTREDAHRDVP